jgi:DNA-binding response OmpR family regulator
MSTTVLVVEDEANLAELLTDILHSSGYEVVLATASRAAERTEEVEPAAIVLDYLMPGKNGADVLKEIREKVRGHMPPVMLVSGLPNVEELARETRVEAFLRKPFDLDTFVLTVDRLVRSAG